MEISLFNPYHFFAQEEDEMLIDGSYVVKGASLALGEVAVKATAPYAIKQIKEHPYTSLAVGAGVVAAVALIPAPVLVAGKVAVSSATALKGLAVLAMV